MKINRLIIMLMCLLISQGLHASPMFNFIEFNYTNNMMLERSTGFSMAGNFMTGEHVFINLKYQEADESTATFDIDAKEYVAGFGVQSALSENNIVYTGFDYLKRTHYTKQIEPISTPLVDDGYQFSIGLRSVVTSELEFSTGLKYVELQQGDLVGVVGATYRLVDDLKLSTEISSDFQDSRYTFGIRFSF